MLLTIAAFLFVLSIVILVHELGHFLVAKMNGIYVITFSLGFGPKILKFKWGETEYAISALPFGGYVKFAGEDADEGGEKDSDKKVPELDIPEHRLYRNKNPYQRMSVVLAGPVMNAVLALLLYIFNIWSQGIFVREPDSIISGIVEGSPAAEAGFLRGDRIIEINNSGLDKDSQISDLVVYEEGIRSTFKILRAEETLTVSVVPEWNEEAGRLTLGIFSSGPAKIGDVKKDSPAEEAGIKRGAEIISINDTLVYTYIEVAEKIYSQNGIPMKFTWRQDGEVLFAMITPTGMDAPSQGEKLDVVQVGAIGIGEYYDKVPVSFSQSVVYGTRAFNNLFLSIIDFLGKLVSGKATLRAVGGPIRVGVMAGDMIRWGFSYLINFLAFFSMNLAIFNLLPILPFDGGHFVLFLLEGTTGVKPSPKVQNVMLQIGFYILIGLMAFILFLDLFNLMR
ncbi:MAG: RIP metalloprotease RseP [Bacteroidales bacterium]|nr:RIP metalloprotease RseP [Candidatus Latescibacterota bacterium]